MSDSVSISSFQSWMLLAMFASCGGIFSMDVTIRPGDVVLPHGGIQFFSAQVQGSSAGVDWSIQEGAAGGTISADGEYTAPTYDGVFHVSARSRADHSKSNEVKVTVNSAVVVVAVTPSEPTVDQGSTLALSATVTGTTNKDVRWNVQNGFGQVSGDGHYTAPLAPGTALVIATSVADPTKSASSTVTVR